MHYLILTIIVGLERTSFWSPGLLEKNRDVQNVCEIARLLHERDDSVCGPVRILAQGLIGVLPTTTAETHLDVCYSFITSR